MTLIVDYNSLVSAVQGYIEDDGDEFTALIENAVVNACHTIVREVRAVGFSELVSVTADSLNPLVPIPTQTYTIETVAKTSNGNKKFLRARPYSYLVDYWPAVTSGGGNPEYYNRLNDTEIYVAPTPTSMQELEIKRTTVSIPSSASPTCYIIDKFPGLLLARVMVEANLIKKDKEDAETWGQVYEREKNNVTFEAAENERDEGYQQVPNRVTPTTQQG